jgi:5-hydroxyisourate hydrolase
MGGGISIHCIDVWRGVPAFDLRVEVKRAADDSSTAPLSAARVAQMGIVEDPRLLAIREPGRYTTYFHVAEYYRESGLMLPDIPYLDVVEYPFVMSSRETHYHLPFKVTPWGFSLFITTSFRPGQ